jgi:mRNA interferase RelE/StbE
LEQLDAEVRRRILRRIVWLGENAPQIIHHLLVNMPSELLGLCRLRVGDYRVLYWPDHGREILKVYRIQHRSEVYRRF